MWRACRCRRKRSLSALRSAVHAAFAQADGVFRIDKGVRLVATA
ncbi:hypothetical protein [Xanthomonas translucens]|nr:hypothetical protein [Xanthomonas translucens]